MLKGSDGIYSWMLRTSWTQVGLLTVVLLMVARNVVKGLAGIFLGDLICVQFEIGWTAVEEKG